MTDYDPYDDAAAHAEAQASVRREQMERRLRLLFDRRPPVFAKPGDLAPDVQKWIEGYLAGERGSLILVGTIGSGKTWSLWKTAETLVRAGWTGRFEIAAAHEVKEAADLPVDRNQLRIWREADLFALDEVGAQRVNDWDADALSVLIDKRWQHQRPTLITSNEADLKGLLGERSASRLVDGATLVRFTGADRRRTR
ncbi:ATP-binding protein [Streptomyces sp.]|uniref:ATP-binding protein n=1 Tax=Streptomyces sp. TaxID=1931 RepID=UPI002F3F5267